MATFLNRISTSLRAHWFNAKGYAIGVKKWVMVHKIISGILAAILIGGGYLSYKHFFPTSTETRYVLGEVSRGTVISTVSASGQVSASNQLEIQPKTSGEIISINVVPGQRVNQGALIAVIDPTDAQKAVRDAELNLESAQLSIDKLNKPTDSLTLTQAQNKLDASKESLTKAYEDGYSNVSDAFVDLPDTMAGLEDILYGDDVSNTGQSNIAAYVDRVKTYDSSVLQIREDVEAKYIAARAAYEKNLADYKKSSRLDSTDKTEQLISETYQTIKTISESIKTTNNFLGFVKDRLVDHNFSAPSILLTHQATLASDTTTVNGYLNSLYGNTSTIASDKRSITENTESLANLHDGVDPIDLKSAELTLTQRKNALADAKRSLGDSYVRVPFGGTIAALNAKKYDPASGGSAIATLITDQKIAELSLNEVDAAKVKVGDKATLSFDAIENLSLTGTVAEVDAIGTVTQGVVSYSVKIGFDSQDERIKSGMTVNAAIQTDIKQDALVVPSSAVKTQNGVSFVSMFTPPLTSTDGTLGVTSAIPPTQTEVVVGISDDLHVEIISGVQEGDQIVVRTITGSANTTTATASTRTTGNTPFGGGRGGATGGAVFIPR